MSVLLASIIDTAVLLAVGLGATVLLRGQSAALRHAVLATFLLAAACAPAFELLLPQHPIVRWSNDLATSSGLTLTSADIGETTRASADSSAEDGPSWQSVLLIVWIAGVAIAAASLLTSIVRLRSLRRRAKPADERWQALHQEIARDCGLRTRVALLESRHPSLLMSCGVARPAIVLPAGTASWSDGRRRLVLQHELAHIARRDGAIQMLAEVLGVVHWFNPLVWIARRRLRHESECACDDAVLRAGVEPADYATQLLAIARTLCGRPPAFASAHAVAHPSTLERRIAAMLQTNRNRAPMTRRIWGAMALLVLAIAIPVASAGVEGDERAIVASETAPGDVALAAEGRVPSAAATIPVAAAPRRQAASTLSGSVFDQSNASMPGVQVTITDTATGKEETQQTTATGGFAFRNLAPSRYRLTARVPGFATHVSEVTLGAGTTASRTITLSLGTLQETLTIVCGGAPLSAMTRLQRFVVRSLDGAFIAELSAQTPPSAPTRVGGNIRVPRKVKDVKPTCPPDAAPVDTTVRARGRVGVDGLMHDVVVVPSESGSEPPQAFAQAAVEAIRQWVFTPTLLNDEPVDVNVTVDVHFRKP